MKQIISLSIVSIAFDTTEMQRMNRALDSGRQNDEENVAQDLECTVSRHIFSSFCRPESYSRPVCVRSLIAAKAHSEIEDGSRRYFNTQQNEVQEESITPGLLAT